MDDELVRGFITGLFASVCEFFGHQRAKNLRIRILRDRLLKDGYNWRSLRQLARAIGQTPEITTDLLIEIGARRSAGEKDVWTLEK
jgi:hypothetical protein